MKISHQKILIVLLIIVLFGSVYFYLVSDLKSEAATSGSDSGLTSSASQDPSSLTTVDSKVAQDIAFLSTLATIKNIKIDTSIFSDTAFKALNHNVVYIEPVSPGRINPFSPVGITQVNSVSTPSVSSIPATSVTTKSASLNGKINVSMGVTNIYFEYGTSNSLGLVSVPVKSSLSGTFNKIITGLTAKTPYYFRAVAKVGDNLIYGDIVSFTTI